MTTLGRVVALWRYPVKSMLGEAVSTLPIEPRGAVGDRLFAIRDPDGKLGSGKNTRRFRRIDGLLDFRSRLDGAVPVVRFPNGSERRGDDTAIDAALTAALGTPVTLAREAAVQHHDVAPLHVLSTGALAWLAGQLPHSAIDVRRFRPNLVIDTGRDGIVEQEWLDRELAIGQEVRIRITQPTERCVMTTMPQEALPPDPGVLRCLAERNAHCLGVYAAVVTPGTIACGDAIALA